MNQTNLETAIRSIVDGTTEGTYEICEAPFDKRAAVLDSCIDRLQAKREADYASATEEMVARAVRQGIDPEVAKRAGELQTAVRAARTDSETTRRIRTLVKPLAKEAGDEAKSGHPEKSLHLIELAMETLREITTDAEEL